MGTVFSTWCDRFHRFTDDLEVYLKSREDFKCKDCKQYLYLISILSSVLHGHNVVMHEGEKKIEDLFKSTTLTTSWSLQAPEDHRSEGCSVCLIRQVAALRPSLASLNCRLRRLYLTAELAGSQTASSLQRSGAVVGRLLGYSGDVLIWQNVSWILCG